MIMCRGNGSMKCEQRPLRVRKNAAFLIDVTLLKNWEDVKDDMNGSYNKILRCGVWTVECVSSDEHVQYFIIAKKRVELEGDNQYHLVIHSKGNKACPDLIRSIFLLQARYKWRDCKWDGCNIIFRPKQK